MGSLISEMYGSDIVATLEVLSKHSVTTEDLKLLRKYPNIYAREALRSLGSARQTYLDATTTEPDAWAIAVSAVERIKDVEMLKHIYEISPLPEVWIKIMETMTDEHGLFYLIFHYYQCPQRTKSCEVGLRNLLERTEEDSFWKLAKDFQLTDDQFTHSLAWAKRSSAWTKRFVFV